LARWFKNFCRIIAYVEEICEIAPVIRDPRDNQKDRAGIFGKVLGKVA
jgi:hypothetical protein